MLEFFKKFISEERLVTSGKTLLLAVSGGIDSVVLTDLSNRAGLKFAIAHCNFGLRGKESDGDEIFVNQLAKKHKVEFHSKRFDTKAFAAEHKVSIQMAARELRYQWFDKLLTENKYSELLVAHHKDDEVETFFINLIRGTGIAGLHGIALKREKIVRPLLFTNRKNIEKYARQNKLAYREDSSNASEKYLRNKLRLKIIPLLKEINPSLESGINKSIQRIREFEQLISETVQAKLDAIRVKKKNGIEIDCKKLAMLNPASVYMYELLKPFGFNESVCKEVSTIISEKSSGKQFLSRTHRLLKNRDTLIITDLLKKAPKEFQLKVTTKKVTQPFRLTISKTEVKSLRIPSAASTACLDFDKLKFPLSIRRWRNGDAFYPLGMKTQKKLSDFFIDNKYSMLDKERAWLLTSGQDIVWVIGKRIDERYKITKETKTVYKLEVKPERAG